MTHIASQFRSVILAGERPGGSALSQAFNLPSSVMVPVAGKPCIQRVIEAIKDSEWAQGGLICGPTPDVLEKSEDFQQLLKDPCFKWHPPATGPALSAFQAVKTLSHYPTLLTAGDHALLTGEIVDHFCSQVQAMSEYDFVIGFVPHPLVQAAFPESKRTVLKFSDGGYCGSNLFAILNPNGMKALSFWRQAEADRKHPWRVARRFGVVALLRYLLKRLSLTDALDSLSEASGCAIGFVKVNFARAAVDVDSVEDQILAEHILAEQVLTEHVPGNAD